MEDIFWILFYLFLIWGCLRFVADFLQARKQILQEQLLDITEQIQNKFITVNIEQYGDIFYFYNKETGEFVAQGSSMNELKEHCEQRYKNRIVVADLDLLEKFGLK